VKAFAVGPEQEWRFEGVAACSGGRSVLVPRIHAWSPDVIAIHGAYHRVIAIADALACPSAVWIHGHEALWHLGGFRHHGAAGARIWSALKTPARLVRQMARLRSFLRRSRHVVFVSHWMQRAAERHTGTRVPQAHVIPNPVDVEVFRYRWSADNLLHGITARSLSSRKYGVDIAIRGMAHARRGDLTVVGTGTLESGLRALAAHLSSPVLFEARFVPHEQMPQLFAKYGYFVAASRVEAQGVAMCEAMACGLPVVATAVGGIPEFVVDGETGFLVPAGDWRALGAAVERLCSDPALAARLSAAARDRVLATCSGAVVVEKELGVLADAAHG
jgi:glycosyltransferase involved in cell wall biosynthesis